MSDDSDWKSDPQECLIAYLRTAVYVGPDHPNTRVERDFALEAGLKACDLDAMFEELDKKFDTIISRYWKTKINTNLS